jgi:hypothetical protein
MTALAALGTWKGLAPHPLRLNAAKSRCARASLAAGPAKMSGV